MGDREQKGDFSSEQDRPVTEEIKEIQLYEDGINFQKK